MTISNTVRTAGPFVGNGITTDFPFAYKIFNRQDLLVAKTVTSSGVETILTLDADYTVTLNPDQNSSPGGMIHVIVPPPAGTTLAATSNVSMVQPLDLTNNGGFHPKVINDALDRIVITVQQLSARVGLGSLNVGMAAAVASVLGFVSDLASSAGAKLVGFLAGPGAVLRTVWDVLNEQVSVKSYGAKGDGVTDDTAAIQAAANAAAGKKLYFPATLSSYKITEQINLLGFTTVCGDGRGSVVKMAAANKSVFMVNQQGGVTLRDLVILGDVAGTEAYTGGVHLFKSLKCAVLNVEFIGMTWAGVLINGSSQCRVEGCRFSAWVGTVQDSSDICIYQNSGFNIIRGNHCYGGGDHGIAIYDPYTNTTPTANIVTENVVDEHRAYGIMLYTALITTQPYNLRTVISNNVVSNILGTGPGTGGFSGAGIYIQAGGGTIITGNSVFNCCRQTTNFDTLGMAGISLQIGETGTGQEVEIVMSNNHVHALRGPCLFLAASNRTITVDNNVFKATSTANVRGEAVIVQNCNGVRFTNNTVRHENPNFYAVKMVVYSKEYSGHNFSHNSVNCVNSAGGFLLTAAEGGSLSNTILEGNTVGGALANPAYLLQFITNLRFIGNHGNSSGTVFSMYNCPRSRMSANSLHSSAAATAITFVGANTNSHADESNDFDGWVQNDEGNGMRITLLGTGAPAVTGSWSSGDRVINIAPAPGAVSAWVNCSGSWKATGTVAP